MDVDQSRSHAQRQVETEVVRRTDHRRQHRRRDLGHSLRHCRVAEREGRDLGRQSTTAASTSPATAGRTGRTSPAAMTGAPRLGTVSIIEPSPFDAGTAYVVIDNHRLADIRPYLYKTSDYGESWRRAARALPPDVYLHVVREDPARRGHLYLGTERGVMYLTDEGATWRHLQSEPANRGGARPGREGRRSGGWHSRTIDLHSRRPAAGPGDDRRITTAAGAPVRGAGRDPVAYRRQNWASGYGSFDNPPRARRSTTT